MSNEENGLTHVSHTRLSMFRRCRQQYYWKYVKGFKTRSSTSQSRGTAGHTALRIWHTEYNAKKSMSAAWDYWTEQGFEDGPDWEQLEAALKRYFIFSKAQDTFKLVSIEKEFDIEYEVPWLPHPFHLIGYIDGLILDRKQTWLLENKFWKRVENEAVSESDAQVSMYMLASSLLGYNAYGTLYNIVRVGTKIAEKEPVIRRYMHRNGAGLPRLEEEMLNQVHEMAVYHMDPVPFTYRNFTKDCKWDCSYYHACMSMLDDGKEPTEQLEHLADPASEVVIESEV